MSKDTLVISRALSVGRGPARKVGLTVTPASRFCADLRMPRSSTHIVALLPTPVRGDSWGGCEPK